MTRIPSHPSCELAPFIEAERAPDDLDAARGIANGCLLAVPLWGLLAALAWLVWGWLR